MSDANARIGEIVNSSDVVLFMKGTPLFPQCGFSSRAIAILDHLGVAYESVDVLQDRKSARASRAFRLADHPQLYVKGEFVGGSDIMMEMFEAGELAAADGDLGPASFETALGVPHLMHHPCQLHHPYEIQRFYKLSPKPLSPHCKNCRQAYRAATDSLRPANPACAMTVPAQKSGHG
jgi:monothiol glutaredoxin